MQKIDYDDFYKFLVSIGIILIGFSLVIPYAFLREDFSLMIESKKYLLYTEQVRHILSMKEKYILFVLKYFPYFCITIFALGFLILCYGLCKWYKRQKTLDTKTDLEIDILRHTVKSLSPQEKFDKVRNEILHQEFNLIQNTKNELSYSNNKNINEYLKIENEVINHFKNRISKNSDFEIYDNIQINGNINIDVLLKSKALNFSDIIIEIKYFKRKITNNQIITNIMQMINTAEIYRSLYNRRVYNVLIVVYSREITSVNELEIIQNILQKDINKNKILIKFVEKDTIRKFDIESIIK